MMVQQEELCVINVELVFCSIELEQMQEEVFKCVEELECISQYKFCFLVNMLYELCMFLNSMLIFVQDLVINSIGNLDVDQVEGVQVIYVSGVSLLWLINEIFDLFKIEVGKIEIQYEFMFICVLIQMLEYVFCLLVQKKGVGFSINGVVDLFVMILIDFGWMEQIVNNLIGNVLKFICEGVVNVMLVFGDDGWMLCFVVCDIGIGILQDKLQMIFLFFEQVDVSMQC